MVREKKMQEKKTKDKTKEDYDAHIRKPKHVHTSSSPNK